MEPSQSLAHQYGATAINTAALTGDRPLYSTSPASTPNPFHSTSPTLNLPPRPPKAAQIPYSLPSLSRHLVDVGYRVSDDKYAQSHQQSYHTYGAQLSPRVPGTSVSSAAGSVMTGHTLDTIDLEKGALEAQSRQHSGSRRSSRVVRGRQEMAERNSSVYYVASSNGSGSGQHLPLDRESLRSRLEDEQDLLDQRRRLEDKALKILFFLSGPCAALSFILCIYSLLATLTIFLLAPIRLCARPTNSLWEQILSTLSSAQRLQLRCIYAPTANTEGKSIASLLCNLLATPFLSMGVVLAAWIVAIYWIFAAIVGDPDGSEGGDDGRATVLGLRKWWESWLLKAVRDD